MSEEPKDLEDDIQIVDFSAAGAKKKKKKGKKKAKTEEAAAEGGADSKNQGDPSQGKTSLLVTEGHSDYSYNDLLERINKMLRDKNPALAEGAKAKKEEDPYVVKLGTTKTSWMNFDTMVLSIDRKHEHLMSYIAAELGVEATLGPENNMILQGKFQGKHIERLWKKYLEQYVRCQNCKGLQTKLEKDPTTRLYMLECKNCGSTKSVITIKAGYHAVKRGERKKAR